MSKDDFQNSHNSETSSLGEDSFSELMKLNQCFFTENETKAFLP